MLRRLRNTGQVNAGLQQSYITKPEPQVEFQLQEIGVNWRRGLSPQRKMFQHSYRSLVVEFLHVFSGTA